MLVVIRTTHMKGLVWLGVIMVIAWAVLWLGVKMAVGAIHLLLLFGLIAIIWGFVQGKRIGRSV